MTLIQRFGSAAELKIHLRCLALDGVHRGGADGLPTVVEADTPTDDEPHAAAGGHQPATGSFLAAQVAAEAGHRRLDPA